MKRDDLSRTAAARTQAANTAGRPELPRLAHTACLVLVAAVLITLAGCTRKRTFVADSVDFDQVYIPALAYCVDGKVTESRGAMMLLLTKWHDYRDRYRNYKPEDRQWSATFEQADRHVSEANRILNTDGSLYRVQAQLEAVRVSLMLLRQRDSIDYYPDYLVDFFGPTRTLVMSMKNQKPESLPDGVVLATRNLLVPVKSRWQKLEQAQFDPKLYGFDRREQAQLSEYIKAEAAVISQLEQALTKGDKTEVISTVQKLMPGFEQIYRLFGDFTRVRAG